MLIGLDPALNADVLYVLRAMGHGDNLVIVDTKCVKERHMFVLLSSS